MSGGTSLDTIIASTSSRFRPRSSINAAQLAPISSAERCASVAIRQRSRSPSPSKAPRTVCVFPISATTNNLQTLLEPPEIESPQHARVWHDEVRPFYHRLAEDQHVYIHRARSLLARRGAPISSKGRLDALTKAHEFDRRGTVLELHDTV